jgi:hypothetical protein
MNDADVARQSIVFPKVLQCTTRAFSGLAMTCDLQNSDVLAIANVMREESGVPPFGR